MARLNVYLPDELHRAVLELPDSVNLSGMIQALLREKLRGASACSHPLATCTVCSRTGTPAELAAGYAHDQAHIDVDAHGHAPISGV